MWKGMIAFDRPTWIRWLNKKSTWFLTGQFFWHYMVNNTDCDPAAVANQQKKSVKSCLVGGLDLPSSVRLGTIQASQGGFKAYRDKIRDWEALFTLAAFSFYRGGSIVPVLGVAVDPVNQWNMEPFWNVDCRPERLRREHRPALLVQPRGHHSPDVRDLGTRRTQLRTLRDDDPADVSVLIADPSHGSGRGRSESVAGRTRASCMPRPAKPARHT
jgi:hypothetical protein